MTTVRKGEKLGSNQLSNILTTIILLLELVDVVFRKTDFLVERFNIRETSDSSVFRENL